MYFILTFDQLLITKSDNRVMIIKNVYYDVIYQHSDVIWSYVHFQAVFSRSQRAHACVSGVLCADGRTLGVEQKALCF